MTAKTLFRKFAEVKIQMAELAAQESSLKEAIMAEFKANSLDKVESDYGKFTIAKRTSYSYSDKVTALEEKVKIAKHKEEEKGIATIKNETSYLVFKPVVE